LFTTAIRGYFRKTLENKEHDYEKFSNMCGWAFRDIMGELPNVKMGKTGK
jgi:hypothetical protein